MMSHHVKWHSPLLISFQTALHKIKRVVHTVSNQAPVGSSVDDLVDGGEGSVGRETTERQTSDSPHSTRSRVVLVGQIVLWRDVDVSSPDKVVGLLGQDRSRTKVYKFDLISSRVVHYVLFFYISVINSHLEAKPDHVNHLSDHISGLQFRQSTVLLDVVKQVTVPWQIF